MRASYIRSQNCRRAALLDKGTATVLRGQFEIGRLSGNKKPININILGGTVFGTNGKPSLGQTGTHPCDYFVPFVPGTGGGSSLGRLSCKGRQKNAYVFYVNFVMSSKLSVLELALMFCMFQHSSFGGNYDSLLYSHRRIKYR